MRHSTTAAFRARAHGDGADVHLEIDDKPRFRAFLTRHRGKALEFIVRVIERVRSIPANRYYWSVVLDIFAEDLGYTREELHDALKRKFLGLDNPDSPLPRARSTATLSSRAFWDYIDQVRIFAADWRGLVIPDPDPEWRYR